MKDNNELISSLLKKLKKILEERNMSIFRLTELADLSENTIYNWFSKGAVPTLPALYNICNILNVPLWILLKECEFDSDEEDDFMNLYHSLSEKQRGIISDLMNEMKK